VKVLQVIEQAFRATGEEQDDTIVWLTRSMRGVGADIHVLLTGNAVFYAFVQTAAPALTFGAWTQTHPADVGGDIRLLLNDGVEVTVVEDDLAERGLAGKPCIEGIKRVARSDLAALYDSVDQVWQW
jgi:sulfur relay (sulfurtransferase) DsrF/TusC family protein